MDECFQKSSPDFNWDALGLFQPDPGPIQAQIGTV